MYRIDQWSDVRTWRCEKGTAAEDLSSNLDLGTRKVTCIDAHRGETIETVTNKALRGTDG